MVAIAAPVVPRSGATRSRKNGAIPLCCLSFRLVYDQTRCIETSGGDAVDWQLILSLVSTVLEPCSQR
jgi:hypothetical protein